MLVEAAPKVAEEAVADAPKVAAAVQDSAEAVVEVVEVEELAAVAQPSATPCPAPR